MSQQEGLRKLRTRLFEPELLSIPRNFSNLLEEYSKVPKEKQIEHIVSLRNRAYKSHPYPCLGRFRFMDLDLSNHPLYPELLSQLKSSSEDDQFLDFGCCIGQDIRKLLFDGAPASRIYGSDLLPEFIETGYQLFRDESTFPRTHFIAPADAFDESSENALAIFDKRVSILHISAVFHLFGLEKQRLLARRCLKLLNPRKKCLVLGGQTANVRASEYPRANGTMRWRHNSESWADLWVETAKEHGGVKTESHSRLHERQMGKVAKDNLGKGEVSDPEQEKIQVIGQYEEGFRWMVWWTWVEFED